MNEHSSMIDTLTGLVIFEIAGKEFCANIHDISAIINPNQLGEINSGATQAQIKINNISAPLIDFRKIFSLHEERKSDDVRILLLEIQSRSFGFYVERVKETLTMSKEFRNNLKFISDDENPFISGILKYEGRDLYMPNFNKLIAQLN